MDEEYLKMVLADLERRKEAGHTYIDLDWIIKRLKRGLNDKAQATE